MPLLQVRIMCKSFSIFKLYYMAIFKPSSSSTFCKCFFISVFSFWGLLRLKNLRLFNSKNETESIKKLLKSNYNNNNSNSNNSNNSKNHLETSAWNKLNLLQFKGTIVTPSFLVIDWGCCKIWTIYILWPTYVCGSWIVFCHIFFQIAFRNIQLNKFVAIVSRIFW